MGSKGSGFQGFRIYLFSVDGVRGFDSFRVSGFRVFEGAGVWGLRVEAFELLGPSSLDLRVQSIGKLVA